MPSSRPESPSKQAGFTLVEMLLAMVVAGIVILASTQLLTSVAQSQGREEITVPVQESVRGAMEVISMDLREAMTPRVLNLYDPAKTSFAAPPAAMSAYYSTNTNLTIIGGDASATFKVAKPTGYPTVTGYPSQAFINVNGSCAGGFNSGDYFYLLYLNPTATDTTNMSAVWGQAAGCLGSYLVTASAVPAITNWTLDARVVKASLTRYYIGTLNGQNVLFRQTLGGSTAGTAQVVAFDITGASFEYSADGQTFTSTAPTNAEPLAVRVTLTGQSNQKRVGTTSTPPYTLSQVVYMRQTSLGKGF